MMSVNKALWTANAVRLRLLGTEIGMPSYVGPIASLVGARNLRIGKRVRIWPGARLELWENSTLTIEDEVVLGLGSHITIGGDMTIGARSNFTGANVITNITHSLREMDKHPLDRPWVVDPVHLGERLFVGHGAKILPGSTLGDGCVVGANAVLANLNAPENSVVVGMPGRVVRIVE